MNNDDFTVLVSAGSRRYHVYCVAITFKMTEQVQQLICIQFCIELEHSSVETIQMIQKTTVWITGDWQLHHDKGACLCITSHAKFFAKTSNHPGDSALLQPRFGALWLLAFPKTKITFKREEISDRWWDSEKYDKAADGNWENCVKSQSAYFEGDWGIIVLCTMFLVPCIFFNKCLYFSYSIEGYILYRLHTKYIEILLYFI